MFLPAPPEKDADTISTVLFREVADFEAFAVHIGELPDQADGANPVVLPDLMTVELMTAVPGGATPPIYSPPVAVVGNEALASIAPNVVITAATWTC